MNMIIRSSEVRWTSPVRVRIGYGFPETIWGPREALSYLQFRWPAVDGDNCRAAKALCADVMEGQGCLEAAREAFFNACIEAKMLAEPLAA
ncbi:hypothetical protein ABID21_003054 [Pseudorhizobium tarimense]|uniref:DUF982 domain-containing protein n=1 Tax=Pseudorhizobium tarimense TaxID=1079109 RepID=A0ABV2H8Q4_9HYPH|nr:DUF982 domain-containing protein [Pseudorhizobium tarimense]MCJ8520056.1 DUF982 domain-containing protein [Pseudorhizobium tarimense]